MSDQIKWPKGQDEVFFRLKHLLSNLTLSPVILVHGRRGIGKSKFLKRLAALIYCDHQSACGACPACHMVTSGTHPDVWLVNEVEGQLKVEDAKELAEHLSYTAKSARVVVFEDVDRMNEQAINRLLKLFEEPPEDTYIFMSTSRMDALLPTLRSRALKILMPPPSKSQVEEWLKEDAIEVVSGEFEELFRRSGASPGMMLELIDRKNDSRLYELIREDNPQVLIPKIEQLVKESGYSAGDVVREMEYSLNRYYRDNLGSNISFRGCVDRRKALKQIRFLAIQKKVALNALSAAESLLLADHC